MKASQHAVSRLQEDWPGADGKTLLVMIGPAEPISPELVAAVCGRRKADHSTEYFLATDHRGIFVIRDDTVVTYIRLGSAQQKVLRTDEAPKEDKVRTQQQQAQFEWQEVVAQAKRRILLVFDAPMCSDIRQSKGAKRIGAFHVVLRGVCRVAGSSATFTYDGITVNVLQETATVYRVTAGPNPQ